MFEESNIYDPPAPLRSLRDDLVALAFGAVVAILACLTLAWVVSTPADAEGWGGNCFVGGSIGANANATRLNDGDTVVSIGSSAPMVSPEAGCKMSISSLMLGGLARYDFLNATAKIGDGSIKSQGRWMAAATLGWSPLPGGEVYALAGISGSKAKFGIEGETLQSYVVGAGMTIALSKSMDLFGEYNAFIGKPKTIEDVKATPIDHAVRAGLRFKF